MNEYSESKGDKGICKNKPCAILVLAYTAKSAPVDILTRVEMTKFLEKLMSPLPSSFFHLVFFDGNLVEKVNYDKVLQKFKYFCENGESRIKQNRVNTENRSKECRIMVRIEPNNDLVNGKNSCEGRGYPKLVGEIHLKSGSKSPGWLKFASNWQKWVPKVAVFDVVS